MDKQDKIFEAFRKNQHKLEEMPSPQNWDRLRYRLDNRKKQAPIRSISRLLSMVAAIVGLVLLVTVVVNLSNPQKRQARNMQEIPTSSAAVLQKAVAAQIYRNHHQLALQQGIEEGLPTKILVSKSATRPLLIPKKKG